MYTHTFSHSVRLLWFISSFFIKTIVQFIINDVKRFEIKCSLWSSFAQIQRAFVNEEKNRTSTGLWIAAQEKRWFISDLTIENKTNISTSKIDTRMMELWSQRSFVNNHVFTWGIHSSELINSANFLTMSFIAINIYQTFYSPHNVLLDNLLEKSVLLSKGHMQKFYIHIFNSVQFLFCNN